MEASTGGLASSFVNDLQPAADGAADKGAGNPCEAAMVASVEVAGCSVAAAEGPIGVAGGNLTATVATDSAAHCSSGADR